VALVERSTIEEALRRHRNNRTAAAKCLGISRVTLYNKLKKYGMTD
jgi:transcriptional regulator with PAS, ATPase and Fis domain